MRKFHVVFPVLGLLIGCAEVPANNPFDPSTPASQQAFGAITGKLLLPPAEGPDDPGFDQSVLARGRVELWAAGGDDASPLADTTPDEEGAYLFEDVVAGRYCWWAPTRASTCASPTAPSPATRRPTACHRGRCATST